jgi:diguanylate cyclase
MAQHASDESSRRGKWWNWFSGEDADSETEQGSASPSSASAAHEPTAREIWLPAKRRMLGKVADFLIDAYSALFFEFRCSLIKQVWTW